MKKIGKCLLIGLSVSIVSLSISTPFVAISDDSDDLQSVEYRTGNILDSDEKILEVADYYEVIDASSQEEQTEQLRYPTSVDLSTSVYFPPIGYQGAYGSCSAFSTTYYQFTYEANKLNNIVTTSDNAYSPQWMYNMINGGADWGSSVADAYLVLKHQGALKQSTVPYSPVFPDFSWSNDTTALIEALKTRVSSQYTMSINVNNSSISNVNDNRINQIKNKLSNGKILVANGLSSGGLSNWTFKNISNPGMTNEVAACYSVAPPSNVTENAHSMTIVGYNDDIMCDINGDGVISNCEKGALKMANSWGNTWKNSGYVWVMYDALNKTSAINNFYVANRVPAFDRNEEGYNKFYYVNVSNKTINLVGLLTVDLSKRYGWDMRTGYYNFDTLSYSWDQVRFPIDLRKNENSSFTGTIVLDYLDCDNSIPDCLETYWGVSLTNQTSSNQNSAFSYKIVDDKENVVKNFGTIFTSVNSGQTAYSAQAVYLLYGDVNFDHQVNVADAYLIQGYDAGVQDFSNVQLVLADANQDGVINIADVTYILMGGGS